MKLFGITTVVKGWPSPEADKYGGCRTVGIYTDEVLALDVVDKNLGDIYETSYTYAVVAEFESDRLYGGFSENEKWFQWEGDWKTGQYLPCEKPPEYANIIGWAF